MFQEKSENNKYQLDFKEFNSENDLKLNTPYLFCGKNAKGITFISTGYVTEYKTMLDDDISPKDSPIAKYKEIIKRKVKLDGEYWEDDMLIKHYAELEYPKY